MNEADRVNPRTKLWTGKTIRQEIVHTAASMLPSADSDPLRKDWGARGCVENQVDGAKDMPGTIKAAKLEYLNGLDDEAYKRLLADVRRRAYPERAGHRRRYKYV